MNFRNNPKERRQMISLSIFYLISYVHENMSHMSQQTMNRNYEGHHNFILGSLRSLEDKIMKARFINICGLYEKKWKLCYYHKGWYILSSFLNLCEEGPDKKFSILTYFDILLQNLLTSIFKYNCVSNKFSFVTQFIQGVYKNMLIR